MSLDLARDEELMAKVAVGNREAMGPLVRRYATPLLTFIQRMLGDRHQAEEVFQDVFLAVWQNRRRYQYPRAFKSWLFGIAANKCRGDVRKSASALSLLTFDPQTSNSWLGDSPVETAIASETATLVAQAVATLPTQQRTVLVLRIWNGQEYSEIAAALGRAESTIRSEMFHAVAAMRRYLEPRLRRSTDI
jgi:RNA polymerase sigma-70 factor (ECF subfamily)